MGRRKKVNIKENNPSENWVITESIIVNGRHVEKGTEISIKDERGRYQFVRHVYNPNIDVEWIDVVGGRKGVKEFRSFRPERVKRVHWKNTMRPTKEAMKNID